jgi:hypothetical protein
MRIDGHYLAGFVAGEGHFAIRPNNAGQSWSCEFQLAQRDDNVELVEAARELVGCGKITWVPPHATSHAQAMWHVRTMEDCSKLASALGSLHLLAKKAGELAIWERAVAVWNDADLGALRWKRMEHLAAALHAHRSPGFRPDFTRVDIRTGDLARFLAGFASAEAHFGASMTGHPRFVIKLRADDTCVLALLADRFAIGRLVPRPESERGRPQTAWLVTRLSELPSLIAVFDRHRPLGRAGRIYRHWRRLVLASDRSEAALRQSAAAIRAERRYRTPRHLPVSPPARPAKHSVYAGVLAAWARETGPPYTATSYECWRSLSAARNPTRNTLASFFGSWRKALAAAGLRLDGTRSAKTVQRSVETAAPARAVAALRRRAAVLRAVDRCWIAIGRVPTASEFFRWRLEHAPASPSQATVYHLFPGGWSAVLEALPPMGTAHSEPLLPREELLQPAAQPVHVAAAAREQLAVEPDVQAGSSDQLRHEGVAGHEVAARQRE